MTIVYINYSAEDTRFCFRFRLSSMSLRYESVSRENWSYIVSLLSTTKPYASRVNLRIYGVILQWCLSKCTDFSIHTNSTDMTCCQYLPNALIVDISADVQNIYHPHIFTLLSLSVTQEITKPKSMSESEPLFTVFTMNIRTLRQA